MSSTTPNKLKNINHLLELPHVKFKLEELEGISSVPIEFEDGKWRVL
jgi:hypothetical protein